MGRVGDIVHGMHWRVTQPAWAAGEGVPGHPKLKKKSELWAGVMQVRGNMRRGCGTAHTAARVRGEVQEAGWGGGGWGADSKEQGCRRPTPQTGWF